jgi:hypothetical protein
LRGARRGAPEEEVCVALRTWIVLGGLWTLTIVGVACGDDTSGGDGSNDGDRDGDKDGDGDGLFLCRETPDQCVGDIGGECDEDSDCVDGECCKDKNCNGGMCTYRCDDDRDCPEGMLCEHKYCFFECDRDDDCGPDQSCEHDRTICEYGKH